MTVDRSHLTWPVVLTSLARGEDLTAEQARWAMGEIMAGEATSAQIAAFVMGLRAKGETAVEVRALADTMLGHAVLVDVPGVTLDVVGTGGDRAHTVNISTMAAIVCAGAGVRVVKHGNRAASSASGSADVLEALGVDLALPADRIAQIATEAGITFCFAQAHHPSLRHAAATRRELGTATVFNFLGPLTNPGQPTYAAVGVADRRMARILAEVFADRGKTAVVFRGDDGLDEVTVSTTTSVWWVHGGAIREHVLDPARLGVPRHPLESLRGGNASDNAQVVLDVLGGSRGPVRDAVVLNAGMALALAEPVAPTDGATLEEVLVAGMARAATAVDDGSARAVLDRWIAATSG